MSKHIVFAMVAFAVVVSATTANAENLLDQLKFAENIAIMRRPNIPHELRQPSAPITPEGVQNAIDAHVHRRFLDAADPVTKLVTIESAGNSGWGFLVDHFAEIDTDHDGVVASNEIGAFFKARSPIERNVSKEIQIIE